MSFTLSKSMRQATVSSAPVSRKAASVRCMALPDAKAVVRKALLGAGAIATALSLTMPAQAFDLPFFNKSPAEKVSNAVNAVKNQPPQEANNASAPAKPFTNSGPNINSATKQTADKAINAVGNVGAGLQNSASQAADKVQSAASVSDLQKSASETADKLKSAATNTSNKVEQSVKGKDMASTAGVAVNGAAADAQSTAIDTANAISGAAGDLVSKIQSAVGASPADQAQTAASNTASKVQGSAQSAQSKIGGALNGAPQLPNATLTNVQTPDLGNVIPTISNKIQAAGEKLSQTVSM